MAYLCEDFGMSTPKQVLQRVLDLKLHDRSVSGFSDREHFFLEEIDKWYKLAPKFSYNAQNPTRISVTSQQCNLMFFLFFSSCSFLCLIACYKHSLIILNYQYSNDALYIVISMRMENCRHIVSTLNLSLCSLFDNG